MHSRSAVVVLCGFAALAVLEFETAHEVDLDSVAVLRAGTKEGRLPSSSRLARLATAPRRPTRGRAP